MAKKTTSPTKALARVRASMKRQRMEKSELEQQSIGKVAMISSAFASGYLEQKLPADIGGVPTKLIGAGIAYLGAFMTKGHLQKVSEGLGDSLSAIYAYKQGVQKQTGQAVSGEDSIEWIIEK